MMPTDLREAVHVVLAVCKDPLAALGEPDKRIFWPHLLVSAIVVAVVWGRGRRGVSLRSALASPALWLHRSARVDYVLFFLRGLLRVTVFAPFAFAAVPLAARLAASLRHALGSSPFASVSPAIAMGVFTAALFIVEDASRFVFHLASHRVGWLWELHKVHHSAEVLTPFTLYRLHPVEGLLNRARGTLTTAFVAGVCAWIFPGKVQAFEILGVDALGFVWSLAGSNLRHSHVWISYGPRLERWLLSPAQHQIHHSVEARHHDRNFGTALALWDRLFGSLYVPAGREHVTVGLDAREFPPGAGALALISIPVWRAFLQVVPRPRREASAAGATSVGSVAR